MNINPSTYGIKSNININKSGLTNVKSDNEINNQTKRIEDEHGLFIAGPIFYRGDETIRDIATFSIQSLQALESSRKIQYD